MNRPRPNEGAEFPDGEAESDPEVLYESLLIAYDEALCRGESLPLDKLALPSELQPRLKAAMECLRMLAEGRGAEATLARDENSDSKPRRATERPPSKIGRFLLLRELGRGGHGVVFLAIDPRLGRLVALKLPRPEVLVTPDLHRRFLREAQTASALTHPNLVPIHEAGDDGPICYIAAGYCEGPTLANWLKQQRSLLPFREAAALVAALAEGVALAHAHGIVHRDIKPANVLLAPAGAASPGATPLAGEFVTPCLTDFGLARLIDDDASDATRTGTMLGTPSYMAPEQATGRTEEIGPATDVYALGAILYELLVGRAPFRGGNDLETLRLVSAAQLASPSTLRPGVPRDLEAICLKTLSASPLDRYAAAAALAADLRRFVQGQPTAARPLSKLRQAARWARRRPLVAALVGTCLAALCVIAGGGWWYSAQLRDALEVSRQARRRSDDLRYSAELRSAWQAFNGDNAGQARTILERMAADLTDVERDFAWQLLWNLTRRSELFTLRGHTGDVYHVVFSPDGKLLATASQDRTVRLWDATTGKPNATLAGHTDEVNAVAWSPDGKLLASASDDGSVRLWDARCGLPMEPVLRDDRGPLVSLVFSADRQYLVSGDGRGRVVFTATADWKTVKTLEVGDRIHDLALSRDGRAVATATEDRGILIWDVSEGRTENQPPAGSTKFTCCARGVAFDGHGRLLCCGQRFSYLWNWQSRRQPKLIYLPPDYQNSIAACGGGRLAAMSGLDEIVRIFDVDTAELRQTLVGHSDRIWRVAASPDGWRLATASADDTVKLWSLSDVTPDFRLEDPRPLSQLSFTSDGQGLIAAGYWFIEQRRLRRQTGGNAGSAWALSEPTLLLSPAADATPPTAADGGQWFSDMAVSGDGTLMAAASRRPPRVEIVDLVTRQIIATLADKTDEPNARSAHIAFSADGRLLAETVGASLRLWDVRSRRIERRIPLRGTPSAIAFSADGGRLAVAVGEHLELRDAATGERITAWQAHYSVINSLAYSKSGLLASASQDRLVRLWNGATGEAVATLNGHTGGVVALSFAPNGRLLASGGRDSLVKLWSLVSFEELGTLKNLPGPVRRLAFSPTQPILAVAHDGESSHLRLWCPDGAE